jgi:hypothetical protein
MYLCHKCGGHLTDNTNGASAYGCHCISGYVRDFQSPTNSNDVQLIQLAHVLDSLDLYLSQGRPESDYHVQWARGVLAKWSL